MVDTDWVTWLLEVNHNPSCTSRTHVMKGQIHAMLRDTVTVVWKNTAEGTCWIPMQWDPLPFSEPSTDEGSPSLAIVGRGVRNPAAKKVAAPLMRSRMPDKIDKLEKVEKVDKLDKLGAKTVREPVAAERGSLRSIIRSGSLPASAARRRPIEAG
jgi:hypothetical protein